MERVTSKHGKGLSLEYTNISCPTDVDTIYALKFTTVRGFLSCFSSKGHWASLEFTTRIAFEFVSSISSGHFPGTTTGKASYGVFCSTPYFGATIQTDFRPDPRT